MLKGCHPSGMALGLFVTLFGIIIADCLVLLARIEVFEYYSLAYQKISGNTDQRFKCTDAAVTSAPQCSR